MTRIPPYALRGVLARLAPDFSVTSSGGGSDGAELVLYVRPYHSSSSSRDSAADAPIPTTCLEMELEPPAGLHLRRLQRCGPGDASGSGLLALVDRFAAAASIRQVTLTDDSKIHVGPPPSEDLYELLNEEGARCDLDYAVFCILATGQSFYNAHGYRSSGYEEEQMHNAALIDRPFVPTLRGFCEEEEKDLLARVERSVHATGLQQFLLKDHFMAKLLGMPPRRFLETATTREVFSAIADAGLIRGRTDCAEPLTIWLNAVLKLFAHSVGGIIYDGSHLVKKFPATAATTASTASATTIIPRRSSRKRPLTGGATRRRRRSALGRRQRRRSER
jgi:hypothetical protein